MDIKFYTKEDVATVKMEIEFDVLDPAKLIGAWVKLPHVKEQMLHESNNSINWAQCILDLMLERFDDEKIGVAFNGSTCDRNPEPEYLREIDVEIQEV